MSWMNDGWQRIIRELQESAKNSTGYISLKVENELLEYQGSNDIPSGEWVSPQTAQQVGSAKLFEYVGGQIIYTGPRRALVKLENYQAIELSPGFTSEVDGTGGLNNTPCENFSMPASSSFGNVAVADNQCRFVMETGDNLNAYVQHNETGTREMEMVKGVYHATVIEFLN